MGISFEGDSSRFKITQWEVLNGNDRYAPECRVHQLQGIADGARNAKHKGKNA